MDSLEFNKIAAAILVALLLVMGLGKLGSVLYHAESPDEMAYVVETDAPSGEAADGTEPAEPELSFDQMLVQASADDGASVANKCKSCHTFEQGGPNRVGPNLWGIVGAEKAHLADFSYSSALTDLTGTWTYEDLNGYLADPRGYAPGTKMTFAGIKDTEDRAALVAYLRTLSDNPEPLPEVEMPSEEQEETAAAEEAADQDAEATDEDAASDESGSEADEGGAGDADTDAEPAGDSTDDAGDEGQDADSADSGTSASDDGADDEETGGDADSQ